MKYGLCLAGGGSLGAYEIGAVKCLFEHGYKFDVITGTSIGAINGSMICAGQFEKLVHLWDIITPDKVMVNGENIRKELITDFSIDRARNFAKSYFHIKGADITPFRELCKEMIPVKDIKNSDILLGVIVTRLPLLTEEKILLNKIDEDLILPYIHASSAIIPVFPTEKIGETTYIDGGYRNNVPIDYAFDLGAEEVFAINLPLPNLKLSQEWMHHLPNVHFITPSRGLGSFMDFTPEVVKRNIQIGYLDTRRYLGELYGYNRYIDISKDDKDLVGKFMIYLTQKDRGLCNFLMNECHRNNQEANPKNIFATFLDRILTRKSKDDLKIYELNEILNDYKEGKLSVNQADTKALDYLTSI